MYVCRTKNGNKFPQRGVFFRSRGKLGALECYYRCAIELCSGREQRAKLAR